MRTLFLVVLPFTFLARLNAQAPLPMKAEVRELRPSDLRDIRLDFSQGWLTMTSGKVQYTYNPISEDLPGRIAACEALLSELRRGNKLLVTVDLPARDHVYTDFFIVQFDSLK